MTRILLADDEPDLVWALRHSLADEGYEVFIAHDGMQALSLARLHRPDLIILDIVMPGLDGLEVCRRLRRDPALAACPILFLTVRSDIEDRVTGLDEGGDDYLVKPLNMRELKARVRALLRRGRPTTGEAMGPGQDFMLIVGPIALDLHRRQVRVGKKAMQLTPAEFILLHYLMVHPGEVFSSYQLLHEVWGYAPGALSTSVVRFHIKNLRFKIEPDAAHPIYIRTLLRHGYMFVVDV